MPKTFFLSASVAAIVLLLPSIVHSQPPARSKTEGRERIEAIEEIEKYRGEMIELQRELNTRRFLETLKAQVPGADLRAVRRQYGIPRNREFAHLRDEEIRRRMGEIKNSLPPQAFGSNYRPTLMMYYGDVDVLGIAEDPGPADALNPFVTDEQVLGAARSVVAIVGRKSLTRIDEGSWRLEVDSLKIADEQKLCDYQRWYGCLATDVRGTGFLVADTVVATAGHVVGIDPAAWLESIYFLFDYVMENADEVKTVYADSLVFKGVEVLERRFGPDEDWALIRLHRRAEGRPPLKCRTQGKIEKESPVYMIGHPDGLPQQYSHNATVLEPTTCSCFFADLDTRSYNSGSPVINADSSAVGRPLVEGILVADKANYTEICNCVVMAPYSPHLGRPGAEVTRATEFAGVLENKDSVLVRCRLQFGDGIGMVRLPSTSTGENFSIKSGEEKRLPWDEYFDLWLPGLDCWLRYEPKRGSTWEIVDWVIPDTRGPAVTAMKMQKVCFP
jgi:hypothetical protein